MLTREAFLVKTGALVWHMMAGSQMSLTVDESPTGLNLMGIVHLCVDVRPTPQKGVQFYLDGAALGSPVLNAPYVQPLDTSGWVPGSTHTLKAVAMFRTRSYTATLVVSGGSSIWPASFTTGPLGANNILPLTTSGAILGLCSGVEGFTGAQQRTFMEQRRTDCARNFDIIHGFGNPSSDNWSGATGWEDWAHSLGSVPMITLQGQSPSPTLANVNSGACDAAYTTNANFLKTKPFRIMCRLFHEFGQSSFPWYVPDAATAPAFVSAYRRVVSLFAAAGASNVGFCWSPQEGDDRAVRDLCYPGDNYVDWVSSDVYNSNSGAFSTPYHSGWAEFYEMFGYTGLSATSCYEQYQARKPFIVAETSSHYDTGDVNRKGNWYRNIASVAKPSYMPNLRGVVFFDVDVWASESQTWRVDQTNVQNQSSTESYQGFKDFAASAVWNVGVQGGAH